MTRALRRKQRENERRLLNSASVSRRLCLGVPSLWRFDVAKHYGDDWGLDSSCMWVAVMFFEDGLHLCVEGALLWRAGSKQPRNVKDDA